MKYLKRFNESKVRNAKDVNITNSKDLKLFCEDHLAYLLDDGLTVRLSPEMALVGGGRHVEVELNTNGLYWSDMRDHLIPLIEVLNYTYGFREDLSMICIFIYIKKETSSSKSGFTVQQFIDEDFGRFKDEITSEKIFNISFDVITRPAYWNDNLKSFESLNSHVIS